MIYWLLCVLWQSRHVESERWRQKPVNKLIRVSSIRCWVCFWEERMVNTGFREDVRPAFSEQTIAIFFEKGTFLRFMVICIIDGNFSSDFGYSTPYCLCPTLHSHLQRHWRNTSHEHHNLMSLIVVILGAHTHPLWKHCTRSVSSRASSPLMKLYSVIGWGVIPSNDDY